MQITVTFDDALYERALQVADPDMDKADLFSEVFQTFVRVQSAKRLMAQVGTSSEMGDIPRRREEMPE